MDQQTQTLVSGYCHRNQKSLASFSNSIPNIIIEIILRFYNATAIINIAVGQCGNQMLIPFIKSLAAENTIDTKTGKQLNDISFGGNTYFRHDNKAEISCSRTLCVDLDPSTNDTLKNSEVYSLVDPNNLCFGARGTNNNWAKGHYTEGRELIDEFMDKLRKEIEGHDEPQAIQFMHSVAGGTGSGMGALIMNNVQTTFPDLPTIAFTVLPSPKVSDCVVETHNTVWSISQMSWYCDGIFVIDNEALYRLATKQFAIPEPTYQNLNFITNQMVNDVTSLFRYDDSFGFNVRSFLNEMTINPDMKYFTFSRAPFYDESGALLKGESNDDVSLMTKQLFEAKRSYTEIADKGIDLSTLIAYRGFDSFDYGNIVKSVQAEVVKSGTRTFKKDIISTSIRGEGVHGIDCGFKISNSTAIRSVFDRIFRHYTNAGKRLRHWYKGEGLDEGEWDEAQSNWEGMLYRYETGDIPIIPYDDDDDTS